VKENGYEPAVFEPKWVMTRNERNFNVAMEVLQKGMGEGRFMEVIGKAGRGKTFLIRRHVANNKGVYILCLPTWKRSDLVMLQMLCRELGVAKPPIKANDCFLAAAERLIADPQPVFLDEMDLLPQRIELVRSLSEFTAAPFVLIGEESLQDQLTRNERVWSRTYQTLWFEPLSVSDIITYGQDAAGLEIGQAAAAEMHQAKGGSDWRVIKRMVIDLVEIANVKRSRAITVEMARQAINMGIKGNGFRSGRGKA